MVVISAPAQPVIGVTGPLDPQAQANVRRRMIFQHHKWDPQTHDHPTLAPFALIISPETWSQLRSLTESLAAETLAAERELLGRPDLIGRLGLPWRIRRRIAPPAPPDVARVMRFDFHPTTDGWRISEVNSDVPGGFIEASAYTSLMCEHYAGTMPTGDPSEALTAAIAQTLKTRGGRHVAMVHATAYTDDRQVMIHLSERLEARGLCAHLVAPDQLSWTDGQASIVTDWHRGPVDAIVRFFPGEWLVNLPRRCGWEHFVRGARIPMSNPATALLTQSKRLPLVWDALNTPMPTWRRLLPETRDPREVNWRKDDTWVVKPALGRVGDGVGIRDAIEPRQWKRVCLECRWLAWNWIVQRRFQPIVIPTPDGPRYPSLGVFAIDGQAAGIYARLAERPLIDHRAQDVAVCVGDSSCGTGVWPVPGVHTGGMLVVQGKEYAR